MTLLFLKLLALNNGLKISRTPASPIPTTKERKVLLLLITRKSLGTSTSWLQRRRVSRSPASERAGARPARDAASEGSLWEQLQGSKWKKEARLKKGDCEEVEKDGWNSESRSALVLE